MRPGVAMFTAPWIFKHHMPAEDSFHYFAQLEFDQDTDEKAYWLIDFENDYLKIIEDWREAISFHINDPQRAEIRIWDILQRMKECWNYSENKKNIHPALKKALLYIELNLSSSFGIPELAEHAGVSHCYLIRLFHAYSKSTVSQYIKKRRMQKARQQILNTSMPIKDIAAESGIPDLHHFNKSIKKEFGLAPRKLRDAANND
jgi:AraC-like DNA-binding protein